MTKETKDWIAASMDICHEATSAGLTVLLVHPLLDSAGQVTLFGDVVITNVSSNSTMVIAELVKAIQQPIPQSTQE